MCSISGFFSIRGQIKTQRYLDAFNTLRHRGPDDQGIFAFKTDGSYVNCYTDSTVNELKKRHCTSYIHSLTSARGFLGHHRLSVIDLSEHGHQPMERNGCILVYNGEVYNYKEIRTELEQKGYTFNSTTDSEVVLAAYLEYGNNCFEIFNGMWALAIHDSKRKKVILSRDHFGIKPLYYSLKCNELIFASELKFFYRLGYNSINENTARDYILHSITDHSDHTMIDGIEHVPPASYIEYDLLENSCNVVKFWSPTQTKIVNQLSEKEILNHIEQLILSSIKLRLRSDVGLGIFLSGGLDSSTILAGMIKAADGKEQQIHSYSSVFPDSLFSEHEDIYKSIHYWSDWVKPAFVEYNSSDFEDHIQKLLYFQDIPFRSLAMMSQYLLYSRVAKDQNSTVILNGQGADEIFGGYINHHYANLAAKITGLKPVDYFQEVNALQSWMPQSSWHLLLMAIKNIKRMIQDRHKHREYAGLNPFKSLLHKNLVYSALPEYLRYEDRNSMAFSKESRLPFLDFRLVDFVWGLDDDYRIRDGMSKWSLREAFKDSIPEHVYRFRDKRGFISPQEEWQKSGPLNDWITEREQKPRIIGKSQWSRINKSSNTWQRWRIALYNEWISFKRNPISKK